MTIKRSKTYSGPIIIKVISNTDLVRFKKDVEEYCQGKTIIMRRKGCTPVPMDTGQGVGLMVLPWCYIEHAATEEEYKQWVYGQKIIV